MPLGLPVRGRRWIHLRSLVVPGQIVMATGNGTYHALAETYRPDLERNGVNAPTMTYADAGTPILEPGSILKPQLVSTNRSR